jgi:hypothetical protein
MSSYRRSEDAGDDAAQPLYRDSNEHTEKPSQTEHDDQTRALQASIRRLRRWLVTVSVLLGLATAYILFSHRNVIRDHQISRSKSFAPESKSSHPSKTHHHHLQVPKKKLTPPSVPSKPITFDRTIFASPSTPEADLAWGNDLTPPGDGFVLIPNPSSYSLPPGQPTDPTENVQGEIYDISVFHQLHCLNHVRTFLFTLKAGVEYGTINETYDNMLRPQEDHVYHCFDYIRQGLMCNADLTVEWPREEENGERNAVDGWGVTHQCKDWVSFLSYNTSSLDSRDRKLWLQC